MINVEKILSIPFDKITGHKSLTSKEKKLILDSYFEATGERKREGCGQCFIEMYLYFRNNKDYLIKKNMGNSKFKLPEGKMIMLHGFDDVLTNVNITDEKAINLLRKNKAAIKCFSVFPENWKELIKSKKNEIIEKEIIIPVVNNDIADLAKEALDLKKKKYKKVDE